MSDELLPCPFCGESNAIICETDYEGNTELVPAYAVSCRTKRCAAGIWSLAMGHFDTKQKAIKAWNTRPDSKPYKYETEDEIFEIVLGQDQWQFADRLAIWKLLVNAAREKQ